MEFLITARTSVPSDVSAERLAEIRQAERAKGIELLRSGTLKRIWRLPGTRSSVQVYDVTDADELHGVLSSLPQFAWMDIDVQVLATHPVELDARDG